MDRLKILSLNIWNRQGPWPERLRAIRHLVAALDPHLVGLQEVMHADGSGNQAEEIARDLGYHAAFGSAWDMGGGVHFGNALLSRFAPRDVESIHLPRGGNDEQRAALYLRVESPVGDLPVFVTHLNWKLHEGWVREQQVTYLAQRVAERAPTSGFPPIVMGDFNAEPDSDEIRFLRGYSSRLGRSVYFADCFAVAGDGSPGYTFCRDNPYAADWGEPNRRIDYIFVRGPDREGRGEPLSARVVGDEAWEGVFPSDHFGVYAEVRAVPRAKGV
jgi:endonuclease/exonuclease/phosphatase family metal-dependent hydrolase